MADRSYQSDDNSDEEEQAALDRFLETGVYQNGLQSSICEQNQLQKAQHFQKKHFKNDADANAALRASFRRNRKQTKRNHKEVGKVDVPGSIALASKTSRNTKDTTRNDLFKEKERALRRKVKASSIFSEPKSKRKLAGSNESRKSATLGGIFILSRADMPERVTSSTGADSREIHAAVKKKKKKILVGVELGKLSKPTIAVDVTSTSKRSEMSTKDCVPSSTVPRKAVWSAMEALAEYGSDSD